MITLQYLDGKKWVNCGTFYSELAAWVSLGNDIFRYRTVDENGYILTDKSGDQFNPFKDQIQKAKP